jgi:hypothetical protein
MIDPRDLANEPFCRHGFPLSVRCGYCGRAAKATSKGAAMPMTYTPRRRLKSEKRLLDERIATLEAFIAGDFFDALDPDEQARLKRQAVAMGIYSAVLGERLGASA